MKMGISVKNIRIIFFTILVSMFTLGVFGINSSVSPSALSFNLSSNSTYSGSFMINNLGNDTLNISLNSNNITFKIENLSIILSNTSFTLLNNTNSTVNFVVNSTDVLPGNYSKNLSIFIKNNSNNITKYLPFNIEILASNSSTNSTSSSNVSTNSTLSNYSFILDTKNISLKGEGGDTIYRSVLVTNTGNKTLHNFRIDFHNLYSIDTDDEIYDSKFDLTTSDGFDLEPGQSKLVRFKVYIPDDISPSKYFGRITFKFNELSKDYPISVYVLGGSYDVNIESYRDNVVNNVLTVYGESGDLITNGNEFDVKNDGDFDVTGINFKATDLTEEVSGKTLSSDIVSFIPSSIDLDNGDDEDVEARISIPDNTSSGTYYGQINMYNQNGEKLDSITLKLVVIGNIYIRNGVKFSEKNVYPGDTLVVSMNISNSGTMLYRNVEVEGTIDNINSDNDELTDNTDDFALNVGETVEKRLYFNIPKDATSGSKTLEIKITYGNGDVVYDLETFNVERPLSDVEIENNYVKPTSVSCNRNVYTYVRAMNYGSLTQDIRMISYINGTSIYKETGLITLDTNEYLEKSLTLDLSNLKPGNYNLVTEILYGSKSDKRVTIIHVENCSNNYVVVHTYTSNNETNTSNGTNNNQNLSNNSNSFVNYMDEKINLFGYPIQRMTFFLSIAVFILLIISLFLKIKYL